MKPEQFTKEQEERSNPKGIEGFGELRRRINVRKELQRIRTNSLLELIHELNNEQYSLFRDEVTRCHKAYEFYYYSAERFLTEMSLAIRWNNGPYYTRKYGGRYTNSEAKLARRYHRIARYIPLDFNNFLLHTRILLDRSISLSRHFLPSTPRLSFKSFNDHKKFFQRLGQPYNGHETYAEYIRSNTDFFDILKEVRDKFIVHAGPKHMGVFGIPGSNEAELSFMIMPLDENGKICRTINVSIPSLIQDVDTFLSWFSKYGLGVLRHQ